MPYQNPYAEATVKTLLKSISPEGYIHNSESISTRIHLNLMNILDHNADYDSGVELQYGSGGNSFGQTEIKVFSSLQELNAMAEAMGGAPDGTSVVIRIPSGADTDANLQAFALLLSSRPNYERIPGNQATSRFSDGYSNQTVWEQALKPHRPSERLHKAQHKVMKEVYNAPMEDPMHSVVFASCHKDRMLYQGRRRGMQFPYWIEVTAKRYYPGLLDHNARNPHELYLKISRELRKPNLETAPKCVRSRARTGP